MSVTQWLVRRLGQTIAPDENFKEDQDDEFVDTVDMEARFWNFVAPDTNFEERDAVAESQTSAQLSIRVPPGAAFLSPAEQTVECIHCHHSTPTTEQSATPTEQLFSPSQAPTGSRHQTSAEAHENAELNRNVLAAAVSFTREFVAPPAVKKKNRDIFMLCSSKAALNEQKISKLRKKLAKDPELWKARAIDLGGTCENGFTPLMGAALNNNLRAAEILVECCGPQQLLLVDLQGKTTVHVAAQHGHQEMVEFLNTAYVNAFGKSSMPPVDLVGRTALGIGLTSPEAKAVKNRTHLEKTLFSPTDRSLFGSPAPIQQRAVTEPSLKLAYGMADLPGRRVHMEDAMVATSWEQPSMGLVHLFGVCDGHGDHGQVSQFVAETVPKLLTDMIAKNSKGNWEIWCKEACLKVDALLKAAKIAGGSTAVLALVTSDTIVVANVGDSRCILIQSKDASDADLEHKVKELSVSDESPQQDTKMAALTTMTTKSSSYSVMPLSFDHKPSLTVEKERIEKAGLTVFEERFEEDGKEIVIDKVELKSGDRLATSRAFGDFEYKTNASLGADEQAVVAVPDVQIHERNSDRDSYLVLACDGVWDVMSNKQVADFVVKRVESGMEQDEQGILPSVGDQLLAECLERKSGDNMSVIVIALSKTAELVSCGKFLEGKTLDFA
jgi:protein phosphatase 1B